MARIIRCSPLASSLNRSRLLVGFLLALAAVLLLSPAAAFGDRAFTPRFSANDSGDITIAADTLMTCPTAAANCVSGRAGAAENDNNFNMGYVDVDGDASTFDSSSSTLRLPAGSTVLFAGLYWGADASAGTGGQPPRDGSTAARSTVAFKVPGATTYRTLGPTGTVLDTATGTSPNRYQGFQDVTALVKAAGAGLYAVGNVQAGTGADRYAGWSLVVAYRDTTQAPRNLTVFDGFKTILAADPPTSISLAGFTTPPAGAVRTRLGFVSYEGDKGLVGDTASLNGKQLSDALNPATNFFNASITDRGVDRGEREPNYSNQLGFDADRLVADGILGNEATSATIGLTTSGDAYYPGVVTFSTDIYAPNVESTKTVTNLTHPSGPTQRGDVLRYTVGYKNGGQDGADAFIARDSIPLGTTYVPGSLRIVSGAGAGTLSDAVGDDRAEYEGENRRVTFRLGANANATAAGRLAANASTSLSFDVKVEDGLVDRTTISNQATARYFGQTLGTPLSDVSPTATTTVAAPDLTLAKSHEGPIVSGAKATFKIAVRNDGTLATDGSPVTVTDPFPVAAFDSIAVKAASGWSCGKTGVELTCDRSDALAAGAEYPPIEVEAQVHDPVPASVTNVASVIGGGDSDSSNSVGTDVGTGSGASDLQVTGRATSATVASGRPATYEFTVRNGGPSIAHDVAVDLPLGADYTDVLATVPGGECTATVHCTIATLAAGEEATVRVVATVVANAKTLTTTATATVAEPADPVADNDTATATIDVPNTADLAVTASATPEHPPAGAPGGLTYTVTVQNRGPGPADAVVVVDTLPELFTASTVTAPGFACNTPGADGILRCTRTDLTAAEDVQMITIVGTVAANAGAAELFNSVRVRAETLDPDNENNQASTVTLPASAADLELVAQGPGGRVGVGDDGTFTLTTGNNGPGDSGPATVADKLPAGLDFVSASPNCDYDPVLREASCTIPPLSSGQQQASEIVVTPVPGTAGQVIENTASVDTPQSDPIAGNNTSTDSLAVTALADLSLGVAVSPSSPRAGESVTVTLTAHNDGPNAATGVTIVDKVPPGFTIGQLPSQCTAAGQTITCALGELASGEDRSVAIVLVPDPSLVGTSPTNVATIGSATKDPGEADNSTSTSITVRPAAPSGNPGGSGNGNGGSGTGNGGNGNGSSGNGGNQGGQPSPGGPGASAGRGLLRVKMVPKRRRVQPGKRFRYRVTVRTVGPLAVNRIRLCTRVPRGVTLVGARRAKVTLHRHKVCWRVKRLGPNQRRRFTMKVRAKPSAHGRVVAKLKVRAANAPKRTVRVRKVRVMRATRTDR